MDLNSKIWRILIGLSIILLSLFPVYSLDVPSWTGPIKDSGEVLSEEQESELEKFLTDVNTNTGIQMAVLTIPSLEGTAIEDYSIKVARDWKLGQAETDSGALLVVAVEDRELRIEVGYGLEPSLTDAKCGLIIRNVITPHFRNGDYGTGITEGIKNMVGVATADESLVAASVANDDSGADKESMIVAGVFFCVFTGIVAAGITTSVKGGTKKGSSSGNRTIIMPTTTFSGSSISRSSSSSSSSSSFRSFSGGGGSFGGGGASGKW
ncbi:MAG: TPM domain-containing protein [Spirochaetaceae bacterium]|nr:TPM domain-containing protein [Spirochaetaceae bacterium]